jgi:hypothetical protein
MEGFEFFELWDQQSSPLWARGVQSVSRPWQALQVSRREKMAVRGDFSSGICRVYRIEEYGIRVRVDVI